MSTPSISALVRTGQIVLTVDTVRLLSDGVTGERDLHAFDYLKQGGVKSGISFLLDKPGATTSFGVDDEFFFELGACVEGKKKRPFRFYKQNGGGRSDDIDVGLVLQLPDDLDNDGKLFFECRSTDHNFTWFFQCLTPEQTAGRNAKAAESTLAVRRNLTPPPPPEEPEESSDKVTAPSRKDVEVIEKQSAVVSVQATSTIAGGSNGAVPAQPAEKDGEEVMNTNGKEAKFVKHIVKSVCKALGDKNVTPLRLKRGKAEGENATLARKAIAQLTCGLNGISPSVVFPVFGNKNSGGVYTLKDGAAKQYAAGGPLKELVDKVQAEIPKNFFASTEGPRANKSDAPAAGPKTRRPARNVS